MKQGIHPDYHSVVFRDISAGMTFLTRSTATSSKRIEWEDGNTYPLIDVDITSASHPLLHRASQDHRHLWSGGEIQPALRQERMSEVGPVLLRHGRRIWLSKTRRIRQPVPPGVPHSNVLGREFRRMLSRALDLDGSS